MKDLKVRIIGEEEDKVLIKIDRKLFYGLMNNVVRTSSTHFKKILYANDLLTKERREAGVIIFMKEDGT